MSSSTATILSKTDVATFGRVGTDFPLCELSDIFNLEYKIFNSCGLGMKFYEKLKGDLTDLSSAVNWQTGSGYAKDKIVAFKGKYYTAKSVVPAGVFPTDIIYWEGTRKFSKPVFEDFFCMFLGPYLSLSIVRNQIPFAVAKFGAEGLISFAGSHYKTAKPEDRQQLYKAIDKMLGTIYSNMEHYIENLEEDGDFELTKFVTKVSCGSCGNTTCSGSCSNKYQRRNGYRIG